MPKRKRSALVKLNNLPMLQNLVRRDPNSYKEEFQQQYDHYSSQLGLFMSDPSSSSTDAFTELIGFIAQTTACYPELTAGFSEDLAQLLIKNHASLSPDLREKIVQSLVLLRNRDVISSITLLQTLFSVLTNTTSKPLRGQIYRCIISDLRSSNAKVKNHKLNKAIQAVLFELVEVGKEDPASTGGLWAVKLTRELWKRGVWDDARAVEIMKEAALSANSKVMSGGARFFLGVDQEKEELEEEDDEEGVKAPDMGTVKHQVSINKKKRSNKKMEKAMAQMQRKKKASNKPHPLNFSALHLLRDPQGFAEALFSKHLSRNNNKLTMEQKLVVLQLISRLVGLHKLSVLSLYSYILKHLTPRQREVTQFLVCAAQATHDLVPPDSLEPIVRKIAVEFVSEGVAGEVATAGLNSIREICARAPLAMNSTLLQDLTEYKGSKDKGVMMAARGLIGLYREVAPEMLKKKDRGKVASIGLKEHHELRYGEEISGEIEGLELLEQWKEDQKEAKRITREETGADGEAVGDAGDDDDDDDDEDDDEDEEAAWAAWEAESDSDSDGGEGWINVESDGEDIDISDSEDEGTPKKKPKLTPNTDDAGRSPADGVGDVTAEGKKLSTLATTKILTPADFKKLEELRLAAGVNKLLGKTQNEDAVSVAALSGGLKRGKSDKEARLATVLEGREDRDYGSKKGRRLKEKAHSSTNKEKQRKKNFLMTLGKAKKGQKAKLTDHSKALRAGAGKSKQQRGHVGKGRTKV